MDFSELENIESYVKDLYTLSHTYIDNNEELKYLYNQTLLHINIIKKSNKKYNLFSKVLNIISNTYTIYSSVQNLNENTFNIDGFNASMMALLLQFIRKYDEMELLKIHNANFGNLIHLFQLRDELLKINSKFEKTIDIDRIIIDFINLNEFSLSLRCQNTCKIIYPLICEFQISDNIIVSLIGKAEDDSYIINNTLLLLSIRRRKYAVIEAILNKVYIYDKDFIKNILFSPDEFNEIAYDKIMYGDFPINIVEKVFRLKNN